MIFCSHRTTYLLDDDIVIWIIFFNKTFFWEKKIHFTFLISIVSIGCGTPPPPLVFGIYSGIEPCTFKLAY